MTSVLVYLAGPEVFLPHAVEVGRLKKEACARHGLVGLFPFDNEVGDVPEGQRVDALIYRANVAMMRRAHCAVLNLTPFRGPGADGGTAFELGFMAALGKPVFGYANETGDYLTRVHRRLHATRGVDGTWRDADGLSVEDFGNGDNLMLDNALLESGHALVRRDAPAERPYDDLAAFEECLVRVAAAFRAAPPLG